MVRVCARRAAGAAIVAWREERQLPRTRDAISLLRSLAGDPEIPPPIREAAHRLTTRVRSDFTPAHAEDPIDDARNIAAYCAGVAPEG
jgi:hypothetical protein